jgi:predicted dehydrogenase
MEFSLRDLEGAEMSDRKIRVAVIGAGAIATRAHIPAYIRNKNATLVALVDADKAKLERVAKKFGIKKYYSSVNELFQNQEVDAVSICTPPNTHKEITLKALTNGAHVLCEKPMATNSDDGKIMLEASQKQERILMVGFNHRFHPNYVRAKNLILSGRIGHVYFAECNYLTPNPLLKWSKSPWFFRPEIGGGVLFDQGPHVFDLINYILGEFPYAISAHASTYFDSPVEDSCVFILEYPDNRTGIGVTSWLSPQNIESLSIHGTSQSLFASPDLLLEVNSTDIVQVSLWRRATESLISLASTHYLPLIHTVKADTYQLEIDYFIKQIRDGLVSSESAINGLNVLIATEAAKEAIEHKRRIVFSSIKAS